MATEQMREALEMMHTQMSHFTEAAEAAGVADLWSAAMDAGRAAMAEHDSKQTKLLEALKAVITAAEIIDGQDSPPADDDVTHLHEVIGAARKVMAEGVPPKAKCVVIYELDPHTEITEATGQVAFYCSAECADKHSEFPEHSPPVESEYTPPGAACWECGERL
jgi:hypothetical protein